MAQWQPVGIELPPGWKDAVAEIARETGCPMRYVWMAAIDGLLALPPAEIERRVIAYEMMARKDFKRLASVRPGECHKLVSDWAAEFAASISRDGSTPQAAKTKNARKSRRKSAD